MTAADDPPARPRIPRGVDRRLCGKGATPRERRPRRWYRVTPPMRVCGVVGLVPSPHPRTIASLRWASPSSRSDWRPRATRRGCGASRSRASRRRERQSVPVLDRGTSGSLAPVLASRRSFCSATHAATKTCWPSVRARARMRVSTRASRQDMLVATSRTMRPRLRQTSPGPRRRGVRCRERKARARSSGLP